MKLSILALTILLSACTTQVPVKAPFPEPTAALLDKPKDLQQIPSGAPPSKVVEIVVKNYESYHELSLQVEAWQKWYEEQKKIYEK